MQPVQALATFCLHSENNYGRLPSLSLASVMSIDILYIDDVFEPVFFGPPPNKTSSLPPAPVGNPRYPGKLVSIVTFS